MLGVDRHDLAGPGEPGDEVAADDERLLVGERERGAALEGRDRRCESDRAGDAVQHDVGVDVANELHGLVDADGGLLDVELRRLLGEERPVRADTESDHVEPARVRPDDVEGLRADRT